MSLFSVTLLLLAAVAPPQAAAPPLEAARAALQDGRAEEAAALLAGWLTFEEGDAPVLVVHGEALAELGRDDEAAHQLGLALERGGLDARAERSARKLLQRLDPLARDAERLLTDVVEGLLEVAVDLEEEGHDERALALAERVRPHARDARAAAALDELVARQRARIEEVRLEGDDASPGESDEEVLPLVTAESEHYRFECNLEPSVVERLGSTMDQVFAFYVQVYFDGDESRVDPRKATVRIHPDRATMLVEWTDPTRAPGGWWSPADWRVVCYDTRGDHGSLDAMLETLFHEASHQFMTMLVYGSGGSAPSWLNEGTATFFEGARAMADGRVLWPDVAPARLGSLAAMLRSGGGPTLADVLRYDEPGSYPPDHYAFGWGLVYFLQEYEDGETLAKAWRGPYAEIVRRASRGGLRAWDLFAEVVLGDDAPGGFDDVAAFEDAWRAWILEEVLPLHAPVGREDRREELRRGRLERYLAAAERAEGDRRAPVPADELLDRALGEIAALRALQEERSTPPRAFAVNAAVNAADERPDATAEAELLLLEADVLERRDRDASAAAALERVLDLHADGRFALDEEPRADLERRMLRLDRGNAPVRRLRLRAEGLAGRAERLLAHYERQDGDWLLRPRDLAELTATLLDDDGLWHRATALRERAIAAGRVSPRSLRVASEEWHSIFSAPEDRFAAGDGTVALTMPGRVAGRIATELVVVPEYTVRARLVPEGETYRSTYHGVVVAGSRDGDWYAVGVAAGRDLVVKRVERSAGGSTRVRNVLKRALDRAHREAPALELAVVVRADGVLVVTVAGGEPLEVELPTPPSPRACVGVLVKDGGLTLDELRVEFLP